MSLRENQVEQIAEWVVEHVDREDYDELMAKLPSAMQKARIKKNTLEHQPTSIWRHYRNWAIHVKGDMWEPLAIVAFIVWAAIIALSIIVWPSPDVLRERVVWIVFLSTFFLEFLPKTVTFIRWRLWYTKHPIDLHDYWRVEDYLS